jgi:hypothetical protein
MSAPVLTDALIDRVMREQRQRLRPPSGWGYSAWPLRAEQALTTLTLDGWRQLDWIERANHRRVTKPLRCSDGRKHAGILPELGDTSECSGRARLSLVLGVGDCDLRPDIQVLMKHTSFSHVRWIGKPLNSNYDTTTHASGDRHGPPPLR